MALRRRAPFSHLPPPPDLRAGAPTALETASARLATFVTPDAAVMTRDAAWTVPAVAAGLQVIAGTIGALPLHRLIRDTWEPVVEEALFLEQIDPACASSSTITRTVEDLCLFPCAWWVVLSRYASGYPQAARYIPNEAIAPPRGDDPDGPYTVSVDGHTYHVPAHDVIRFDSPTPGLLTIGGRALATALALEGAASRLASTDIPSGALKNSGADLPPAKVDELLALWETARRTRTTAYLSGTLDYQQFTLDADAMQLTAGRDFQVAEIGRLMAVPTRYINAPTTSSLTYSTTEGQRRELADLTLRPYLAAVEDRLSMGDVTPRTQVARFYLDDFLRGDTAERIANAAARIDVGMTSPAEERKAERIPGPPPPAPKPAPVALPPAPVSTPEPGATS